MGDCHIEKKRKPALWQEHVGVEVARGREIVRSRHVLDFIDGRLRCWQQLVPVFTLQTCVPRLVLNVEWLV